GITVRSSFICGFPDESEEAHEKLKKFISEGNIDFAGFFPYSREEGTPADKLNGHLDEEIKIRRADELQKIEQDIIINRNKSLVGKIIKVIYDDIDYDGQRFMGRAEFQTPDVDNVVFFTSDEEVNIGNFYQVKIVGTEGIDLIGQVI
ncbi:MAG: 30S ribosomal protein S12 methylthiotransferase RimO, partial [Clostridia bacterium]|nr:30S ribosomal protein S12 methylthiotransferase RimO [Clostridia bacterium]